MNALAVARSSFATSLARYRRSWGLWLLLLVAPVSARYWIAGKDAASAAIVVNGKAPVLTSAVVGLSLGVILSTVLLPIIFIYLRSNTTRHQPWQVEETTAASRVAIGFGRFGADIAVLAAVLATLTLAGWLLAWVVGAVDGVRPLDIGLSLWLIAAPALMGVAAVRALCDSLPLTRGALGEVGFFVVWIVSITVSALSSMLDRGFVAAMLDFSGFVRPIVHALPHDALQVITIGRSPVTADRIAIDVNSGLLSTGYVVSRLLWAGWAVALVALAGVVYRPHRPGKRWSVRDTIAARFAAGPPPPAQADAPPARAASMPWLGVLVAEFRLIGRGRAWRLLALVVALAGLVGDFSRVVAPALVLLLIFGACAQAGRSEPRGLLALTRTLRCPPMLRRIAFVVAAIAWSLTMALPAIVKAMATGSFGPLAVASAAGAIVAIVAISLGAWTRSAVAARLILLIAWYAWITAPQ